MATNRTLWLKHKSGATHRYDGRRARKLIAELEAGRGGAEIALMVADGYEGFLALNGEVWALEALTPEHIV